MARAILILQSLFRLSSHLPPELKSEPILLPVQSDRRHMLLALHLRRLDRYADLFISAFEEARKIPRIWPLRSGFRWRATPASSPADPTGFPSMTISSTGSISNDAPCPGNESSYFLALRAPSCRLPFFRRRMTSLPRSELPWSTLSS